MNWETVIGLEVHIQLLTHSKAYSNDINEYGSSPNTNVSAITLGHPGTLPFVNKKTIEYKISNFINIYNLFLVYFKQLH